MAILNLESETLLSSARKNVFAFITILILILSIYSNTFDAEWQFDDYANIIERKEIQLTKFSWKEIKKSAFLDEDVVYRPVVNFTLALNYYFGKTDVFGYRLVNICVHILAAFFLFLLIYHTLNLPLLRPKYGEHAYFIALLAALLWAINPVQTQAVTYIVQRMAGMAAMFCIMAMYFYVKGRTAEQFSFKVIHFGVCAICGIMALGSKENTVMLPICILLFDLFLIQGLTKRNIKRCAYILLGLLIVPPVVGLLLRGPGIFNIESVLSSYEYLRPYSCMERVLTEPRVILLYLSLLFYPIPNRLCFIHDISISHSLIDPLSTIMAILTILVILALCIIAARRFPFISYCILFFFLNHLIEGSVLNLELIFEHRNYLPSILLFAPFAILFVKGIRYFDYKRSMQVIITVFIILLLVGWGHSTFERNYVWQTEETLWIDAKEKSPALIRPYVNLANYYYNRGLYEKSLTLNLAGESKKILSTKEDTIRITYNTGLAHHKMGHLDEALEYYRKAEKKSPQFADLYNNIGLILVKKGQIEEAKKEFLKAILCDEDYIKANKNLSLELMKEGQIEEALLYLNRALGIDPNDVGSLGASGYGYRLKGRFGLAFGLFEKALGFALHDEKTHLYIAEMFFKRGMGDQAMKHIEEFVERGTDADLRGYVKGTYQKENEIKGIRPYKKMVLSTLSQIYAKDVDFLREKVEYINNGIPELE